MRVRAGTSGYAYSEWRGPFYPANLQPSAFLSHYASRLPTVEINNTFYRMPQSHVVASWYEQTPPEFAFALKASQRITHQQRLKDSIESVAYLFKVTAILREKLGPVLFQLPAFLRKDVERLRGFLNVLPRDVKAAFEFRHESWFDSEVYDTLTRAGAALCCCDSEASRIQITRTTDWGYLRLRNTDYSHEELTDITETIGNQSWQEAFVFFKHESQGPALAERFNQVVQTGPGLVKAGVSTLNQTRSSSASP